MGRVATDGRIQSERIAQRQLIRVQLPDRRGAARAARAAKARAYSSRPPPKPTPAPTRTRQVLRPTPGADHGISLF